MKSYVSLVGRSGARDRNRSSGARKRSLPAIVVSSMLLLGLFGPSVADAADAYVLGPQDKVKIRVFEWRPVAGTTFEWTPFNGVFEVSAGGNLSLPLIGAISAAGRTPEQVAETIGEKLKAQIGLQTSPKASVEISEYRPFFVTGLVGKPGKYEYSPDLTVVQALSVAGGTFGLGEPGVLALQRDAMVNRGDLRILEIESIGLIARQARLDAVLADKDEITFPAELLSLTGQPVAERVIREERALFDTRLKSLNAQIASINQAKSLATNEANTLKSKAGLLSTQIDLANKELGTVTKLTNQGLAVASRQIGAVQGVSELESRALDTSLALLKAQQDIAKADRDIVDLRNKYRGDALAEASEVRTQLATNREKTQTAQAVLQTVESQVPTGFVSTGDGRNFTILIDRRQNGTIKTIAVQDNDAVLPGDVIRVQRRSEAAPGTEAAPVQAEQ